MFHRLPAEEKNGDDGPTGSGVGLAICRRIVDRHGGRITIMDHGDIRGACFRFSLPAVS